MTPKENLIRLLEASKATAQAALADASEKPREYLLRHIDAMDQQLAVVAGCKVRGRKK